jgi:cytochrome b561
MERQGADGPMARYTATAQWLHWITALLILAAVPIAWQMP